MHHMELGQWQVVNSGTNSAEMNMALDVQLLEGLASGISQQAILHLYEWNHPSATYGYFIKPQSLLCLQAAADINLHLARRPTGGGIIFHLTDFAFSILVPEGHCGYSINTMDNYAFVNNIVIGVISQFKAKLKPVLLQKDPSAMDASCTQFCMAKPTKYDVVIDNKKVAGGAQRRTKHGFLHQGTISLMQPDNSFLNKVLLPGNQVLQAMQDHSYALLEVHQSSEEIAEARRILRELFIKNLRN